MASCSEFRTLGDKTQGESCYSARVKMYTFTERYLEKPRNNRELAFLEGDRSTLHYEKLVSAQLLCAADRYSLSNKKKLKKHII
jgi:hypothetical protein